MKLNYEEILARTNELYSKEKTKNFPPKDLLYWAPEMLPKVESDSVKCMLKALVEAINARL